MIRVVPRARWFPIPSSSIRSMRPLTARAYRSFSVTAQFFFACRRSVEERREEGSARLDSQSLPKRAQIRSEKGRTTLEVKAKQKNTKGSDLYSSQKGRQVESSKRAGKEGGKGKDQLNSTRLLHLPSRTAPSLSVHLSLSRSTNSPVSTQIL